MAWSREAIIALIALFVTALGPLWMFLKRSRRMQGKYPILIPQNLGLAWLGRGGGSNGSQNTGFGQAIVPHHWIINYNGHFQNDGALEGGLVQGNVPTGTMLPLTSLPPLTCWPTRDISPTEGDRGGRSVLYAHWTLDPMVEIESGCLGCFNDELSIGSMMLSGNKDKTAESKCSFDMLYYTGFSPCYNLLIRFSLGGSLQNPYLDL